MGALHTCNVHKRTPDSDVLVRLNGNAGTVSDALDAPAELLRPFTTIALALPSDDLVFARLATANPGLPITGRVQRAASRRAAAPVGTPITGSSTR